MGRLKFITLITATLILNAWVVNAQFQGQTTKVIQCGEYSLTITVDNQLDIVVEEEAWTIAEMNKAELLSAIAKSGGLTKADPKDSKPVKKASQQLKNDLLTLLKETVTGKNLEVPELTDGLITLKELKVIHDDGAEIIVLMKIVFTQVDEDCFNPEISEYYVDYR